MDSQLEFSIRKEGDKKQTNQERYINIISFALKVDPEIIKTYLKINPNPIDLGKLNLQDIYASSEKEEVIKFYEDLFFTLRYMKIKKLQKGV